ncbi:MAG: amidophosphoribosyltransferase [Bacteroidetes bacterium]|nr:amidophosphoribosyltransferase [Bacteroidota bacterium]
MSENIKHECGIALLRLLKPLQYYAEKYDTPLYGLNKLYLLMEKQHNRGQDGAGIITVKTDTEPGMKYMHRYRTIAPQPIKDIFDHIHRRIIEHAGRKPERLSDTRWLKQYAPYTGELLLGHLRYGTFGRNSVDYCHPVQRQNNWKTRTLALAGNFNLTNVEDLFKLLVDLGQHPKEKSDTVTILEKIGHFVDEQVEELFHHYKNLGHGKKEISYLIADNMNIPKLLTRSAKDWDGGYVIAGVLGHGDAFVMRDPAGIRPAWYYHNDEVAVVTSERPVIQTTFNVDITEIEEIKPGHVLVIKKDGIAGQHQFKEPVERKSCSFERIYFSRGSDIDIYNERKKLGQLLAPSVLMAVDHDLKNTVFAYIPNTAETAFLGLVKSMEDYLNDVKKKKILEMKDKNDESRLSDILNIRPRVEKVAIKDAKLRTFITNDVHRDELVEHVYDVTYGTINPGKDNLVVVDDSIVRGTTLKQSIIKILDRLHPKKIVIVSSAPQIRYPDCYGIDMAKLGDLIAFRAAVSLLKERFTGHLLDEILEKAIAENRKPRNEIINVVKEVYRPFSADDISVKIASLLRPESINAEFIIVYQSIENLHAACPGHTGDWYFTGDYPTPGGNKVANRSFINFMQGKNVRAY